MSSDSFPGCLLELEEHAPCIFRLFLLHGLPHTSFPVNAPPSILTNMAFQQSHLWREAATSICRAHESPDDLCPLRQALRLLRRRADFDVIVTMGARASLAYGLLCALLCKPSKQIMTEVFLDPTRPASPLWRLKTACFRWIARRAYGVLTNSSGEVPLIADRFDLPKTKLRFVPMYTTIENPGLREENDGTVISIGRTLRDLPTLLAAASSITAPIKVVAGQYDHIPSPLPVNVEILREIPLEQTYDLLSRAAVAVAPLLPAQRSTGQVFFFEAMAMGKPVVATRSIGTTDYLRDNENALLVDPTNPQALAAAVNRLLADSALAARLAARALEESQSDWTPDAHAHHKLQAIAELYAPAQSHTGEL